MSQLQLQIRENLLATQLMPLLVGEVFHVTRWSSYLSIRDEGFVRAFPDGRFYTCDKDRLPFGVRNRYVCLFDLRGDLGAVVRKYGQGIRSWMDFLRPYSDAKRYAYLILSREHYDRLIPNSKALDGKGWPTRGKFIPSIECWHPAPMSVGLFSQIYDVTVTAPPPPGLGDGTLADIAAQVAWDNDWGAEQYSSDG